MKKIYDFFNGLITPSGSSTLLTLIIFFLFFIPLTVLSEKDFVKIFYLYPGVEYVDETSYAYLNAALLDERRNTSNYHIFLVGASTLRETLLSEEYMQKTLKSNFNISANVVDLTSSSQPWWVSKDLIDNFTCGRNGVLILAANFGRWGRDPFFSKNNFFTLPKYDEHNFFQNQLKKIKFRYKFVKNIFRNKRNTLQISKDYGRHRYLTEKINTEDRINRNLKFAKFISENYEIKKTDIRAFLKELVLHTKKCSNMKIILLDTLINPEIYDIPGMPDLLNKHKSMMIDIASELNIEWYDFYDLDLSPEFFYDQGHLKDYGSISRATEFLSSFVGKLIKGQE